MTKAQDTVLSLHEVTKTYPGAPPLTALRAVDLEVQRGELLAIVGPSGSGKSTLLHVMGTLDRPTSGTVTVGGVNTNQLTDTAISRLRSERIGFVFQQFHLVPSMTALHNVAEGLLYAGASTRHRRTLARAALHQVGLGDRDEHKPSQLSGGERQRVAIARALVGSPDLILADEPTGNLDSVNSASVLTLLRELNTQGSTIVVITHDMELAGHFDRRVDVRDGCVSMPSRVDRPGASA